MNALMIKVLAGTGLLIALALFEHHRIEVAEQRGFDRATSERAARDATQERIDNARADKDTKARQEKADAEALKRQQENAEYESTINDLRRAARAGNSGMRAPGACLPTASTGTSGSTVGGLGAEDGYVLLPETAESVLDAAAGLRKGVLDRNALIDKFNECRAAANAP